MAKCKTCKHTNWCKDENGRRYNWCPIIDDCPDPEADRECDKHETMTNADRIRAMSDEELAEFLLGIDHYWGDGECIVVLDGKHMEDSKSDIVDWLQSEAEVEQ